MISLVLLHGAWHGAWCWDKLLPLIISDKIDAIVPSLLLNVTDNNINSQSYSLDSHIDKTIETIKDQSNENIVLIGHSYAGMILPKVAHTFRNRIKGIICLDAFLPLIGQCLLNLAFSDNLQYHDVCREDIANFKTLPTPHPNNFGVTNNDDVEWMRGLLRPQPFQTFCDQTNYTLFNLKDIKKLFILCLNNEQRIFKNQKANISFMDDWIIKEITEPHDAMITNPVLLSEVINNYVSQIN